MRSKTIVSLALSTLMLSSALSAVSAPPKPAQKPKPKPKTNAAQLASKGTSQLPGAWCDFGKSYTLGKKDGINFCLKSAEYRVQRVKTGDGFTVTNAGRKLLVLHGFVHNCLPRELWISSGTLKFTAVDADSQNTDLTAICIESTGKNLDQTMKPAQKIECYIVLDVTGKGEIPKLMVANNGEPEAPIARYDLKGKVGKVEELYLDPADKTGATALDEVSCKLGGTYELVDLNIKVDGAVIRDSAIADWTLDEGNVFAVFSFETTNLSDQTRYIGGSNAMYTIRLVDADGVSYEETIRAIAASSDREVDLEVGAAKTVKYRTVFTVPKGVQLKSLTLKVNDSRVLNFDVSSLKS